MKQFLGLKTNTFSYVHNLTLECEIPPVSKYLSEYECECRLQYKVHVKGRQVVHVTFL